MLERQWEVEWRALLWRRVESDDKNEKMNSIVCMKEISRIQLSLRHAKRVGIIWDQSRRKRISTTVYKSHTRVKAATSPCWNFGFSEAEMRVHVANRSGQNIPLKQQRRIPLTAFHRGKCTMERISN